MLFRSLEKIARGTPGFSGADLENLVNEAALWAARQNKKEVEVIDFEMAKDKVLMGAERKSLMLTDEEKRTTAYHEAGHALIAKLLPGTDPVHKVTIIPRGQEAQRLAACSIHVLRLDDGMRDILERWGIYTLGALAELPAKELSQRLGQDGVRLRQLAAGGAERPLNLLPPPRRFQAHTELDDAISLLEPLIFILNGLLDQVFAQLRRYGLAALELHLQLKRERPHEPDARTLRLPFPVQNPRIIARLLMLDLEARPPGAGVNGVVVEAIPSKPRTIQNGLFVPLSPEPEKLELTLARIQIGRAHV